eukprot:gene22943-171_t
MSGQDKWIQMLLSLARQNVKDGGRPFACLIVDKDNELVSYGVNEVAQTNDPTKHAEITAINVAAKKLGTEHFTGCTYYILAHPCPMCLAAINPDSVLVKVNLAKNQVYREGLKLLAETIIKDTREKKLEELSLAGNWEEVEQELTHEVIALTDFPDQGVAMLSPFFRALEHKNCQLRKLNLSENCLSDVIGSPLSLCLSRNTSLCEVNLN